MFNLFLTAIAMLAIAWAIWFLIGLARYICSGDYEVDQRLENINRG